MMLEKKWTGDGVFNMEQMDPDPFMDDLKTRANMPVRTVVEPALAVYTSFGGGGAKGKSGGGVGSGGGGSRERERGGGGARGKARVGIEPVYKFRL